MKNLLEELVKEVKRFQREIEEENDIYSMFFFIKSKINGELWVGGQRKEFLDTLKKINFDSKKELIEKIEPYFEEFTIKTNNFCYKLDSDVTSDNIIIGWQWKAL